MSASDTQTLSGATQLPALRPMSAVDRRSDALDKAAIILMTLDQTRAQQIFARLDDGEIRRVSRAMATLGRTDGALVERTVSEFHAAIGRAGNLVGSAQNTERMLRQVLPPQKVMEIMRDITGATGQVWEKLTQIPPETLAGYLSNEAPQTVSVVLAKLPAQHAARVLALLPDAAEVAVRIVCTDRVQNAVLTDIEDTLRREFVGDGSAAGDQDRSATLAELLNHSDKAMVQQVMAAMTGQDPEAASRVRSLMFGFEDLLRVDPATFGALVAECPADKLPIALATADGRLRDVFLSSMSERAGNMLREEIESMPPPRKRAVDEARAEIVALAKKLADDGRIFILNGEDVSSGDEGGDKAGGDATGGDAAQPG
jgi:flagellar motor switch protein FliG